MRLHQLPFYGITYRTIMRVSHYFGWHYAPIKGPMEDGAMYQWCQWCGLRNHFYPAGHAIYREIGIEANQQQAAKAR